VNAVAPITGISGVSKVVLGYGHMCALTKTALTCWGDDSFGQAGGSGSGTVSFTKVHPSVDPVAACSSTHTMGSACGLTVPNACGESADCGACVEGTCDPGSHTCVCNAGCDAATQVCLWASGKAVCRDGCAVNAATGSAGAYVVGSHGFAVDSPDVYGSAACQGFIADDDYAIPVVTYAMPKNPPTQANCAATWVDIKSYDSDGNFVKDFGTGGHWSMANNACSWGTDAYPWAAIPTKPSGTRVRYVAYAQGPYVDSKGNPANGIIPVHIFQLPHPG
jgi:hypothetical protein